MIPMSAGSRKSKSDMCSNHIILRLDYGLAPRFAQEVLQLTIINSQTMEIKDPTAEDVIQIAITVQDAATTAPVAKDTGTEHVILIALTDQDAVTTIQIAEDTGTMAGTTMEEEVGITSVLGQRAKKVSSKKSLEQNYQCVYLIL